MVYCQGRIHAFVNQTVWGMFLNSSIGNRPSSILWCPEYHPALFAEFGGKLGDTAIFHAGSHAMLDTRRFQPFSCEVRAENAGFGGKWEKGQIQAAVRQFLFDFKDFNSANPGLVFIFLRASDFTAVASRTIFVIYQQTVFRTVFIHSIHPAPELYIPGIAGS